MAYNSQLNKGLLLSGLCCALLMTACESDSDKGRSIEERATVRWQALLDDDIAGAYEYLSPGTRSSVPSAQYQRSILTQQVKWTGARYISSDCNESACKVKISLNFMLRGALPGVDTFKGTREIEESWVFVEGEWYLVP